MLACSWAGIRSLTIDSIWYDEWYSLYYAGAAPYYGPISVVQTVERTLQYNEYNPPSYYVLLNLWAQAAGWAPFAGRALSLLLGILAVAALYRLGCLMAGRTAGLGAAVGLGTSAFFIQQLHELRMYTLFTLMVTLTLLTYWQLVYRKPNWRGGIFFALSLTCLLYTHYMALPLIIALGLYHLLFVPKSRQWVFVALLAVGCGLLYLPWLSVALKALSTVSGEGARNFFANDAAALVNNVLTQFSNGGVPLLAIFGWYALRGSRRNSIFIFGLLMITLGLVITLNERLHFISIARYLIALWPLLALIVGLGIAQMQHLKLRPLLLVAIWLIASAGLVVPRQSIAEPKDPDWQVTLPWDKVVKVLNKNFFGRPNDTDTLVYLLPRPTPYWFHAPLVDYYLHPLDVQVDNMPAWLQLAPPNAPRLQAHLVESQETSSPEFFEQEAQQVLANSQRIWLAYNPTDLPSPFARPSWQHVLAQQGMIECGTPAQESTLQMSLYVRVPEQRLTARFGDGIQVGVVDVALSPQNQSLLLIIGWAIAADVPANTYSIGLYIDDAQGNPVAQTDFGIPNQQRACTSTAISVAGLASGSYTLSSAVYNWQTGERLIGQSMDMIVGERPQLAEVTIPAP